MDTFNLDPRQLIRIEAVHGGFLYQHLYAAACLFQAARAAVTHVVVENDEDVELVRDDERIYAQIKKRASNLIFSDIEGALERFDAIRAEHAEGRRNGTCRFAVITNSTPGPIMNFRSECSRYKPAVFFGRRSKRRAGKCTGDGQPRPSQSPYLDCDVRGWSQ